MKTLALGTALLIAAAAPAASQMHYTQGPNPKTCMGYVHNHYYAFSGLHSIIYAPFFAGHAGICAVSHPHELHAPQYAPQPYVPQR